MTSTVTATHGLYSIMNEYGVSLQDLYDANPDLETMHKAGQIPSGYKVTIPNKNKVTTPKTTPKVQSTSKKIVKKHVKKKPKKPASKKVKNQCKCDAPWMNLVKAELGKEEKANRSRVEEYVAQAMWNNDKISWKGLVKVRRKGKMVTMPRNQAWNVTSPDMAWCSCFACWAIDKTNKKYKTNFSRAPRGKTPEKAYNWSNNFNGIKLSPPIKPPYGAVLVLKNVSNTKGHATFVSNYSIKTYSKNLKEITITALGGNQFNAVAYKEYKYRQYKKGGRFYQMKWNNVKKRWEKKTTRFILNYVLPPEYGYSSTNPKCYKYNSTKGKRGAGDDR